MKIHKDGTLEGTPEELSAYMKLQSEQQSFKFIGPPNPRTGDPYILPNTIISTTGVDAGNYPGSDHGPYRLDRTTHPYERNKAVFAYNGDPTTNEKSVFALMVKNEVSEISGVIS